MPNVMHQSVNPTSGQGQTLQGNGQELGGYHAHQMPLPVLPGNFPMGGMSQQQYGQQQQPAYSNSQQLPEGYQYPPVYPPMPPQYYQPEYQQPAPSSNNAIGIITRCIDRKVQRTRQEVKIWTQDVRCSRKRYFLSLC